MQKLLLKNLQNIQIKEWTVHADAGNTGSPDYIVVVTEPMYTTAMPTQSSKHSNGRIAKKVLTERTSVPVASSSKTGEDFDLEDMDLALCDDIETDPDSTARSKEIANKPSEFTGHQ